MKLILSSGGVRHSIIHDEFLKVIGNNPKNLKLAFISSAYSRDDDTHFAIDDLKILQEMGFDLIEIDLFEKNESELDEILEDVDIIYVEGGNTYVLLDAINKSGFTEVLRKKLDNGVLYFGTSAGAYVACPTIEMCEWSGDRPNIPCLSDLSAMKLVPFILSVHFNRATHNNIGDCVLRCKLPVKILCDNQALLINNDQIRLLGEGEEVVIK